MALVQKGSQKDKGPSFLPGTLDALFAHSIQLPSCNLLPATSLL
jgi:hypothetical protein